MYRNVLRSLAPDLLLAAGILASTLVANRTAGSGWLVMTGPLVLALSLALAGGLAARRPEARRGEAWSTAMVALILFVAGAIVTAGDPAKVAAMMPILGASAAMPVILRRRQRGDTCEDRLF